MNFLLNRFYLHLKPGGCRFQTLIKKKKWRHKLRKICIITLRRRAKSETVCSMVFFLFASSSLCQLWTGGDFCDNKLSQLCSWLLLHPLLWTLTPDLLRPSVRPDPPSPVGVRHDGRAPPLTGSPCCPGTLRPSSVSVVTIRTGLTALMWTLAGLMFRVGN